MLQTCDTISLSYSMIPSNEGMENFNYQSNTVSDFECVSQVNKIDRNDKSNEVLCRLPWELAVHANSVYQALFAPSSHKSLGVRLLYQDTLRPS